MTILKQIKAALLANVIENPEQVKRFFKTSPGSYGETDEFIGVTVPVLRKIAIAFSDAHKDVLQQLLCSRVNEERLLALLILVRQYQKADTALQYELYQFYMDNLAHVNNWNLVDSSAHLILGAHLWDKDRAILKELARSDRLWERRVAIVSTWYFIRKNDLNSTFQVAEILLNDKHDLIHKAVGWMLREAGKQSIEALINFLQIHVHRMPKTMLRYSMEKLTLEQKAMII